MTYEEKWLMFLMIVVTLTSVGRYLRDMGQAELVGCYGELRKSNEVISRLISPTEDGESCGDKLYESEKQVEKAWRFVDDRCVCVLYGLDEDVKTPEEICKDVSR